MSETKTPRTDAEEQWYGDHWCADLAVPTDFARQLETELNEARAEIAMLKTAIDDVVSNGGLCDYAGEQLEAALEACEKRGK